MNKKTIGILFISLLVLQLSAIAIPAVTAQAADGEFGIFQPLTLIIDPILNLFGQGEAIKTHQTAIARVVIWIAVFAVVYQGLSVASGQSGWIKGNVAIALAFCFATISIVFMPEDWIIQIGAGWAQATFLVLLSLIMVPVAILAFVNWNKPPLSAGLLLLTQGMLFYYYTIFGRDSMGAKSVSVGGVDFTGIIMIAVNYALIIVLIALIIQVVRSLTQLGSGYASSGSLGSGVLGRAGDFFRQRPAPETRPNERRNEPPTSPAALDGPADQQDQQLQNQINGVVQQMNQAQQMINQMNQFIATQGNQPLTATQIQNLLNAIEHMINLQQQYNGLLQQMNAAQPP
ncbi:MAG: hypothetical protein AABX51_09270 [Nanoarchaeota archaeon]